MGQASNYEGDKPRTWIQSFLLGQAHQISRRVNKRLWELEQQFPANAAARSDSRKSGESQAPSHSSERRHAPRFLDRNSRVTIFRSPLLSEGETYQVVD